MHLKAAASSLLLLTAPPLQAAAVIQNITATASSWWGQPNVNSFQRPANLVNNSGLSAPYDLAATHAPNANAETMWHAVEWNNDPNPTLTFNLGGAFNLAGIHIWNGNQVVGGTVTNQQSHIRRGVHTFQLSVSTNGGANYTLLGSYQLAVSPLPGTPISAQNIDLAGQTGVTHVQLRVISTHNSPAGGGNYASLSEVMFTQVDAIPEPGTALLGGLGLLGLLRRRR
jgi:hypothetical protein